MIDDTETNHEHKPRRKSGIDPVCKHCGVPLRPVWCSKCAGVGEIGAGADECRDCKGTGIKRWAEVK